MSVKKNFLYNLFYQILVILAPLITTPYISRIFGPNGVGSYSYSYSVANYFVLFAMLGIMNYGNRKIASVRDDKEKLNKEFSSILVFHLIISLIVFIFYISYVMFISKYNDKTMLYIQIIYVLSSVLDINWLFFGLGEFKITVVRNTLIKIGSILLIFIFVKESTDLYKYSIIMASSYLLSNLYLWIYLKRFVSIKSVSFMQIKEHFKPCILLFIPVLSISIYKVLSKIMLGTISNITELGYFENADKLTTIPIGIITALGTVMLPTISNLVSKGESKKIQEYTKISLIFAVFISFGAMFGLLSISDVLIPIFLGEKFLKVIVVLKYSLPSILFLAWANVIRTQYLIPNNLDKIYISSTVLGAIVNIVLNFMFIKPFGAIGAAIGTLGAEISVCVYQSFKVRNHIKFKNYIKYILVFLSSGIIMLIINRILSGFLNASVLGLFILIIIGGITYLISTIIILNIIKEEYLIKVIRENINNKLRKQSNYSKKIKG